MALTPESMLKIDRTVLEVCDLKDRQDDLEYWLSRTVDERFMAIEMIRQVVYGYYGTSPRLQRVLEVAEFKTS